MSELIDIWRVIELLSDKRCDCNFFVDGQTAYEALSDMIKAVKELPRIDLVRCGECEHCEKRETAKHILINYCEAHGISVLDTDYCNWGERRAK